MSRLSNTVHNYFPLFSASITELNMKKKSKEIIEQLLSKKMSLINVAWVYKQSPQHS